MAWFSEDYKLGTDHITGLTAEPISKQLNVGRGDSPVVVDVTVASGTGTVKIQDSNGDGVFNTKAKTVTVTGAGVFSITLFPHLVGDQANYPLRNSLRVVMDTTAAVVISSVKINLDK